MKNIDDISWIKYLISIVIFLMIFIMIFNYIVNPYNVFEPNRESKFNRYKNNIDSDRMTLFYELKYVNPKTLIAGSSRVGLFRNYLIEPYVKKPIFNLALAGSSIYEQAEYIKYAIKTYKLDTIIWSLDFSSFNPDKRPYTGFSIDRLNQNIYFDDFTLSLMSYKTFERSLKTLKDNRKDNNEYSYLYEQNKFSNVQGRLFNKKVIQKNINMTLADYASLPSFLNSNKFKNFSSIDSKLKIFTEVVKLCKKNKIKLKVYTSPVYYRHVDLYYKMGLGETYSYWKKELALITSYTDFCTKNEITNNIMNFRDSSHIVSSMGKLVFARIFNDKNTDIPDDFGIYIDKKEKQ